MAHGGGPVSALKARLAWSSLLAASAFTALALIAVPRRADRSSAPTPAIEEPKSESVISTTPTAESEFIDTVVLAEMIEPSEPEATETVASSEELLPRRAPAAVTTVAQPRVAIEELLAGARGLPARSLADATVALGPGVLPTLLAGILGSGEWPDGEAAATEDVRQVALRDAWSRYEPRLRAEALLACGTTARDELRVLIELAGSLGDESALPTALQLARKLEPADLRRGYVAEPVEQAVAAALLTTHATEKSLIEQCAKLGEELAMAFVRGCAQSSAARGPALAARCLGRSVELDAEILTALAHPNCKARSALGERALDAVRAALDSEDPRTRRAACAVLGNARDGSSLERLVECLDDVDPLVHAAARDALRACAGKDLGGDPQAWRDWQSVRAEWLLTRAPELRGLCLGADCDAAMSALLELVSRQEVLDVLVSELDELSRLAPCENVKERAHAALTECGTARALSLLAQ